MALNGSSIAYTLLGGVKYEGILTFYERCADSKLKLQFITQVLIFLYCERDGNEIVSLKFKTVRQLSLLGPVVQSMIRGNPRLPVNLLFWFSLLWLNNLAQISQLKTVLYAPKIFINKKKKKSQHFSAA